MSGILERSAPTVRPAFFNTAKFKLGQNSFLVRAEFLLFRAEFFLVRAEFLFVRAEFAIAKRGRRSHLLSNAAKHSSAQRIY
jgi:hypothetical protein